LPLDEFFILSQARALEQGEEAVQVEACIEEFAEEGEQGKG
jgi:hypothetical protein